MPDVVAQVRGLVAQGVREVTLLGQIVIGTATTQQSRMA